MQVAAQHPETHRQRAGQSVEEWFLLDGIALERAEIVRRDKQRAGAVEAHTANAVVAVEDQATMAASVTADFVVGQFFVQLPRLGQTRQLLAQRLHLRLLAGFLVGDD